MKIIVMYSDFTNLAVLDSFDSLIWTERYWEYGDFELVVGATKENIDLYKQDRYIWLDDSDEVMIIEDIEITTDIEQGDIMTIMGRSLTSILDRRVAWASVHGTGNISDQIKMVLEANCINATESKRNFPNLIYRAPDTFDPSTYTDVFSASKGENIYERIQKFCQKQRIGFHIFNDPEHDGTFVFQLYSGTDRSYEQKDNPYVIFSPDFNSLSNSTAKFTNSDKKNVMYAMGQEDYSSLAESTTEDTSGYNRREGSLDATDVEITMDNPNYDPDNPDSGSPQIDRPRPEIEHDLMMRAQEELSKLGADKEFDGSTDQNGQFVYRRDYNIGDIVQVKNVFGLEFRTRIEEYIRSYNESGFTAYPSFVVVGQEGDDE